MTTTKPSKYEPKVPETAANEHTYTPKVDIWESANSFSVVAEMAGVEKDGVNVKLEKGV